MEVGVFAVGSFIIKWKCSKSMFSKSRRLTHGFSMNVL